MLGAYIVGVILGILNFLWETWWVWQMTSLHWDTRSVTYGELLILNGVLSIFVRTQTFSLAKEEDTKRLAYGLLGWLVAPPTVFVVVWATLRVL